MQSEATTLQSYYLAELTALSQKGFAREPRELLAIAQWSDHVSGFLVSCEPYR